MRRRADQSHTGSGTPGFRDRVVDFVAWQFAALARFGSLSHFDLDFVGVGEIVSRHSESTGCDLFNR